MLSHSVPDGWPRDGVPYTFITTGFADAVRAATTLAGDKDVALAGPDIIRQAIDAGLVEEIRVNLAPWILGHGIRFFDNLAAAPVRARADRGGPGGRRDPPALQGAPPHRPFPMEFLSTYRDFEAV